MELILRGSIADHSGSGDGSGDGSGYGSGYGDGDGFGSGSGDGDGSGSGYGDGDLVKCIPVARLITKDDLRAKNACLAQFRLFLRAFPDGCNWPADAIKARDIGLDVSWARTNLGLLFPV